MLSEWYDIQAILVDLCRGTKLRGGHLGFLFSFTWRFSSDLNLIRGASSMTFPLQNKTPSKCHNFSSWCMWHIASKWIPRFTVWGGKKASWCESHNIWWKSQYLGEAMVLICNIVTVALIKLKGNDRPCQKLRKIKIRLCLWSMFREHRWTVSCDGGWQIYVRRVGAMLVCWWPWHLAELYLKASSCLRLVQNPYLCPTATDMQY